MRIGTAGHAELVMHPLRARILYVLAGREMTTQQIARELPDVSQASVYRHVRVLADADILRVVREVPVRGIVERVYAFDMGEATLRAQDMTEQTASDFLRYFQVFVNALLDQYRLYSTRSDAHPAEDGVAFWGEVLYLTAEERQELVRALQDASRPFQSNAPSAGRTRFHLSRIFIPDKGVAASSDNSSAETP